MITAEDFMRYSMGKTNRPAAFKYEIMNPMTLELKVKANPAMRRFFLRMAKRINRQRRLAKVKKKWAENAARNAYFNRVLDSVDAGARKMFRLPGDLFINEYYVKPYWDEEEE